MANLSLTRLERTVHVSRLGTRRAQSGDHLWKEYLLGLGRRNIVSNHGSFQLLKRRHPISHKNVEFRRVTTNPGQRHSRVAPTVIPAIKYFQASYLMHKSSLETTKFQLRNSKCHKWSNTRSRAK